MKSTKGVRKGAVLVMIAACVLMAAFVAVGDSDGSEATEVTGTYDSATKTLTISGDGETYTCGKWMGSEPATSLKKVVIQSGITSISKIAFYGCTSLENVTIPGTVKSIGADAFSGCSSLASITIPDSVETIYGGAFKECTALTEISVPGRVTTISSSTFSGCSSLATVTLGTNVTSIEPYAFNNCTELKNFRIPDSVKTIGVCAFLKCSSMTAANLSENVETIGAGAFRECTSLKEITIPSKVTKICNLTFYLCSSLETVTLGENVETIGDSAFKGCEAMTTINIPNKVTSIDRDAFYECKALEQIALPESVKSIGGQAFYCCYSMKTATIGSNVETIGPGAFRVSGLESISIPDKVEIIDEYTFCGCSNMTSVTIGSGVKSIGKQAFYGCTSLESVPLPNGLEKLFDKSFYNCTSLEEIAIPDSVTYVEGSLFYGCTGLKEISIGEGITNISGLMFQGCDALTSATIGSNVATVSYDAFSVEFRDAADNKIKYGPGLAGKTFVGIGDGILREQTSTTYYTITWKNDDSTVIDTTRVEAGTMPTHDDPVKVDTAQYTYSFMGWSPELSEATENTTYTAQFDENIRSYVITFINGRSSISAEMAYGTVINAPDDPVKDPDAQYTYTFDRWDGFSVGMTVTGDATFEAKFTESINSYKIVFKNGDRIVSEETLEYGKPITAPSAPSDRDEGNCHYEFIGWNGLVENMTAFGPATFEAMFKITLTSVPEPNTDGDTEISVSGTSISVPGDKLGNLKTQTSGSAVFGFEDDSISLDNATLSGLSGDVDLSITEVAATELTDEVRDKIGDRPVYNISLSDGSGAVHNLGGKAVVTLKYDLKAGEDPENLIVWYISDTGEVEEHVCTYANGYITFETDHFSHYAIMYESPSGSPDDNTLIIVAVAVIALIAVLGLFLFMRSRKAGSA